MVGSLPTWSPPTPQSLLASRLALYVYLVAPCLPLVVDLASAASADAPELYVFHAKPLISSPAPPPPHLSALLAPSTSPSQHKQTPHSLPACLNSCTLHLTTGLIAHCNLGGCCKEEGPVGQQQSTVFGSGSGRRSVRGMGGTGNQHVGQGQEGSKAVRVGVGMSGGGMELVRRAPANKRKRPVVKCRCGGVVRCGSLRGTGLEGARKARAWYPSSAHSQ